MLEYARIKLPIKKRAAGDNILHDTAHVILLVIVRGTDNVSRKIKSTIVSVPGLKKNIFYSLVTAKKGVKTTIGRNGSSLDFRSFIVFIVDHLDLTIMKESRRTESALCAVSRKTFGKKSVLTALVPKKSVALLLIVGSINIDQRVVEDVSMEDNNTGLAYKIHDKTNDKVCLYEQVASNTLSFTIGDTDKKGSKSLKVSFCKQT